MDTKYSDYTEKDFEEEYKKAKEKAFYEGVSKRPQIGLSIRAANRKKKNKRRNKIARVSRRRNRK